jgi:hypothetical protein
VNNAPIIILDIKRGDLMEIDKCKDALLVESVKDIQSTIRALDVKTGFLFVFLCIPFSRLEAISPAFLTLIQKNILFTLVIILFFIVWGFSLFILFMAVSPQNNPADSVDFNGISKQPRGFLFGGYLFQKISPMQYLNSSAMPERKNNLADEIAYLKNLTEEEYIAELMFERLKLITIRNLKLQRISICIKSIFLLIIIATIIWVCYLLIKA